MSTFIKILVLSLFILPAFGKELSLGDDAPEFFLIDQEGYYHSLKDHRGKFVLLFFYPRDFIPYSISEVLSFEKSYGALKAKDVVIYGVSNDYQDKHKAFHDRFHLTYDLLSDPDEEVIRKYGARSFLGRTFVSYLIGPDGRIFRKYERVAPSKHPSLVLSDLAF